MWLLGDGLELGVIRYRCDHITVLDRPKLETLSCECYAVVKAERIVCYRLTPSSDIARVGRPAFPVLLLQPRPLDGGGASLRAFAIPEASCSTALTDAGNGL